MDAPDLITVVSAEVRPQDVDALADVLAEMEVFASTWEDREGGPCRVEIFLENPDGATDAGESIVNAGKALGLDLVTTVGTIRREDWAESWKRFFKVERVSRRIVVRPPWEKYAPKEGEHVLVLDPGMSFGTGKHATTRTCLKFLDALADENPNRDMLDIGCGSGILSIAAWKLGFRPVDGIDIDEDAVRIAAENAAENGADVNYRTNDLAQCPLKASVVAANVLAPVLIHFASQVAACVRDGGDLILSGILDAQYGEVRAAYEALGFKQRESVLDGEWRSGLFSRRP